MTCPSLRAPRGGQGASLDGRRPDAPQPPSGALAAGGRSHFCRSSALSVALFGFLFSWKCFTGGVRGPASVVSAFLFKYWHSRGSMADASHSFTARSRNKHVH